MTVIPQISGAISGVVGFVSSTVIPAITAVVAAIGWPIAIAAVIVLPVELDGKRIDRGFVDEIIQLLSLGGRKEALPGMLSGGQQQRVAIARALAVKPKLILADEPTGNLDSVTGHEVMGLLKVVAKRYAQTIVLITHDQDIAQMADRIVHIEDGRIVGAEQEAAVFAKEAGEGDA